MQVTDIVLLDTKEAAKRLCVSTSLMKLWRVEGKGPKFVVIGERLIRYSTVDLDAYINKLTRFSSNAEAR